MTKLRSLSFTTKHQ